MEGSDASSRHGIRRWSSGESELKKAKIINGSVSQQKRIVVPEQVISFIQQKVPEFPRQGRGDAGVNSKGWKSVISLIESDKASLLAENESLSKRVAELEKKLEEVEKPRYTVAYTAKVSDEFFKTRFGVTYTVFQSLFALVEKDLLHVHSKNVKYPKKAQGPESRVKGVDRSSDDSCGCTRERNLSLSLEDVLGVFLRRVCKAESFKSISESLIESKVWIKQIFSQTLKRFCGQKSCFSKMFLRPPHPQDVWEYTKQNCEEVVDFLKLYVEGYTERNRYVVVALDGTHFHLKNMNDFFLHLNSFSFKKQCCTLLSVAASSPTGDFLFFGDAAGGKQSETSFCEQTDIVSEILKWGRLGEDDLVDSGSEAHVVFLVDKGFNFLPKKLLLERNVSVFIPERQVGDRQLDAKTAAKVRAIARVRQSIEYFFGRLKNLCGIIQKGILSAGAEKGRLKKKGETCDRIVRVCFGLYNAVNRLNRLGWTQDDFTALTQTESFLLHKIVSAQLPPAIPVPETVRKTINGNPMISPDFVAKYFKGHFASRTGKDVKATNLIAKGSRLVLANHIAGFRVQKKETQVNLVFVVLSSFRTNTYHTVISFQSSIDVIGETYCTCFVGKGQCIHKAACLILISLYQKHIVPGLHCSESPIEVKLCSADNLHVLQHSKIAQELSWRRLCSFYSELDIRVTVHKNVMNMDLKGAIEQCKMIRSYRHRSITRGMLTIGDRLEQLTITHLQDEAEGLGLDVKELEKRWRTSTMTKKHFWVTNVLAAIADSNSPESEEARRQLDVLNRCPCGEDLSDPLIKCSFCRQWFHKNANCLNKDVVVAELRSTLETTPRPWNKISFIHQLSVSMTSTLSQHDSYLTRCI